MVKDPANPFESFGAGGVEIVATGDPMEVRLVCFSVLVG
jgi:hypothetical protein